MKVRTISLLKLFYVVVLVVGSIYALSAQTTIYYEDFSGYSDGTTSSSSFGIDVSDCNIYNSSDYFEVRSNKFEARDVDGDAIWYSTTIDISNYQDVSVSISYEESGSMESDDYVQVMYTLDGGSPTQFSTNGYNNDDFGSATATQAGLNGSSLIVGLIINNDNGSEYHRITGIEVTGTYVAPSTGSTVDIFSEPFTYSNGTTSGSGWSINTYGCNGSRDFEVDNNKWHASYTGCDARWISDEIDISNYSDISITMDIEGTGDMESSDILTVFYILDGGSETYFSTNGYNEDSFSEKIAEQTGLNGSTLRFGFTARISASDEHYYVDNVLVQGTGNSSSAAFEEDFDDYSDGATSGGDWTLTTSGCNGSADFEVNDGRWEASYTGCDAKWLSDPINISSYSSVNVSMDIEGTGDMESDDHLIIFYILDGGSETNFDTYGYNEDAFSLRTAEQTGLTGSTLRIGFKAKVSASDEHYYVDNILVQGAGGVSCFYNENFDSYSSGATTSSKWTISGSPLGYFEVRSGALEGNDLGGPIVWRSAVQNITNYEDINISIDLNSAGNEMEDDDTIAVYYKINGGAEVLLSNGRQVNDFSATTATATGLNGNTLQLVIRMRNTTVNEFYYIDNITMCGTPVSASNPAVTLSSTVTDAICNGDSDGEIDITVETGTAPYAYLWSTGTTSEDLTDLASGVYTVTVTDNAGETVTETFEIDEPSALSVSTTATNISCNGGTNGSIDLTVSGGTTGYSYQWSNSANTQDISNLAVNIYYVTVTDGNGCTVGTNAYVVQPDELSLDIVGSEETSDGANDGEANLTVSGGTSPYTYSWSTGSSSQDISGLGDGTYTVTVTDANGCTATDNVVIATLAAPNTGLTGYCYRLPVVIQSSQVAGSGNHTNFPVFINITNTALKTTANGGKVENSNGYDIVFTSEDGTTELDYQLYSYTASTGNIQAWVRVPSLSTSSNTTIYAYYGNDDVSTNGSTTGTWNSSYKAVLHLDENLPSNSNIYDATSNGTNGTKQGSTSASNYLDGKLGKAFKLDGSDDYYQFSQNLNTWLGGTASFSAWVKTSSTGANTAWTAPGLTGMEEAGGGNDIFWGLINSSGKVYSQAGNGSAATSTTTVTNNAWHYVTITRDATSGQFKVYIDGQLEATTTSESGTKTNAFYSIGRVEDSGGTADYFNGQIDEVHILNQLLDAGWIMTEYNNQNSPSTFYTVGSEETMDCDDEVAETPTGPEGYGYCKTITTNPSYVYGSGSHTDFPFLVSITDNELKTVSNGGYVRNSNGYDIIFTSADGATQYEHELERYNASTGAVLAWVRIPSLSTSAGTEFKMYFGNASVSSNQSSNGTWANNYLGVWHLNSDLKDATANGHNGTGNGVSSSSYSKIGTARSFDGNDYISIPYSSDFNITDTLTLSAWIRPTSFGGYSSVIAKQYGTAHGDHFNFALSERRPGLYTTNCDITDGQDVSANTWYYFVARVTANARTLFLNGVEIDSRTCSSSLSIDNNPMSIGGQENGTPNWSEFFRGTIDEARVSTTAHSDGWIKTEYYNQNNPTATITVTSCSAAPPQCFIWEGGTSGSWTTGSNWSCGEVPTCDDDVVIPSGTSNTATITSGNTGYARNLTIETGATISMGTTGTLNICGDLNVSGTMSLSGGTVKFVGSQPQELTSTRRPQFKHVVIQNTSDSGLVLNNSIRITGTLSLNDGYVYSGTDTVYLTSTSGNGATILEYSDSSFIVGRLNRAITTNSQSYIFPVGKNGSTTGLYWVEVKNKNLIGTSNITAYFSELARHSDNELNFTDQDITYTRMRPEGMWTVEPNSQPILGKYDLEVGLEHFPNLQDNNFGLLKRPRGGLTSAWNNGNGSKGLLGSVLRLANTGRTALSNLTSFSEFGVGEGAGGSLPIQLVAFNAVYNAETAQVDLDWETEVEIDNDYYEVQRSIDGLNYELVAIVEGAGNSAVTQYYTSHDENPPVGLVYYRLKQVDFDGAYTYSDMVPVMVHSRHVTTTVKLYPNPAKDQITIELTSEAARVSIMVLNMNGALVHMVEGENPGQFRTQIDISEVLPAGQYLVRIIAGEDEKIVKLIVAH